MRLFVSLELPVRAVESLALLQEDVAEPLNLLGADIAWTRPERLRLNLDVAELADGIDLPWALEALGRAFLAAAPIDLSVQGARFEPADAPRLIVAGVDAGERLLALREALVEPLAAIRRPEAVDATARPWTAATQLARVRAGGDAQRLDPVLRPYTSTRFGHGVVDQAIAVRTSVADGAAVHRVIGRFALGGGGR